eukprot:CAMPEP_0115110132 /NCGR_PEP_ID=MMETSP0227-20121206/39186_1 /TAXON_ID=89957 /ORGANISM="Polarella glacialis, Strain CCMP 1383" /LENGTH=51 /DNA_ID=CAMNT_0002509097 /DNA_START=130 /DNA_END=285 /DNA_ORIENTATION=-
MSSNIPTAAVGSIIHSLRIHSYEIMLDGQRVHLCWMIFWAVALAVDVDDHR